MKRRKIIFTGGGSAGHVTLNLNLIPIFQKNNWKCIYIGSEKGIEKELITKISGVRYHAIKTGKLRRYFSFRNILDMFNIPIGIIQAIRWIAIEKPDIVFSKGGFVSFPVVIAAYLRRCKVYMHESDVSPGLANRMSLPFVDKFFTTFPDTQTYVKNKSKVHNIGPVLSDRIEGGDKARGMGFCHFLDVKPIIMFVGGSLGASSINNAVWNNLDSLLEKYQIIHICGKGHVKDIKRRGYAQFEFVNKEFKDLLALADIVVSRSGSNAIFELFSLRKPMLLIPLPSTSSRGEQTQNAQSFHSHGCAEFMYDDEVNDNEIFLSTIDKVYDNRDVYIANMEEDTLKQTTDAELYEAIVNG